MSINTSEAERIAKKLGVSPEVIFEVMKETGVERDEKSNKKRSLRSLLVLLSTGKISTEALDELRTIIGDERCVVINKQRQVNVDATLACKNHIASTGEIPTIWGGMAVVSLSAVTTQIFFADPFSGEALLPDRSSPKNGVKWGQIPEALFIDRMALLNYALLTDNVQPTENQFRIAHQLAQPELSEEWAVVEILFQQAETENDTTAKQAREAVYWKKAAKGARRQPFRR